MGKEGRKSSRLNIKVKAAKRQPSRRRSSVSKEAVSNAYSIALNTLRDRYTEDGIYAGKNHFTDVWIRDCFYACWGSLSVGDTDIVKISLQSVLDYLNHNGQVPLRIGAKIFLLRYFGFKVPKQARYMDDKGFSVPTDGNSLVIITSQMYLKQTGDTAFFKENFDKFVKLINWNLTRDFDHDLLMEDGYFSTWADSVRKRGKVMYTNALHYAAFMAFSDICRRLRKTSLARHYMGVASRIKEQANLLLWNGSYYLDFLYNGTTPEMYVEFLNDNSPRDIFSSSGNVLAGLFGLADKTEQVQIQRSMESFGINDGFCTITNAPKYHKKHIYPPFRLIGLADYHNGLQWLWLGCVDAVFKYRAGFRKEAYAVLNGISKKIVEYGGVYEVYDNGKPVKRLFYKSEEYFAWSSGLFVWACNECGLVSN